MNEPYYIFPGSPAYESPETFKLKLKYKSFPEVVSAFKNSKMSFFYNIINYDGEHLSGTTIKSLNKLLLVSSFPLFLTTGSKDPDVRVEGNK